ncbi:hypothetical protein ACO22_01504 [Paracoccidioides brasiliensis]|uniref:Xeroderma pigmentosum group C-complementing protein n=1 Tax=Paracoccidioides brasiliensis TaxID=121759 RepID=A0A1D2JLP6_PARBR|nr:hypothetical protein ACO22_01504 [Paracoccidioides brasiliensis]
MRKSYPQSRGKGKAPVRRTASESVSAHGRARGLGVEQRVRSTRLASEASNGVTQVYRDMLAEIAGGAGSPRSGSASNAGDERPLKRRRVGETRSGTEVDVGRERSGVGVDVQRGEGGVEGHHGSRPVQTVFDADASDDESEMEWEDVEVSAAELSFAPGYDGAAVGQESNHHQGVETVESEGSLQITLEKPTEKGKQRAVGMRRKPVTAQERRWRLDIHKMHVLCLLGHVQRRNLWCNDDGVQNALKRILSKHTIMCLNPKANLPQFTRSTTFADGLKQASDAFKQRFKVTSPGMKRPYWLEHPNDIKDPTVLLDTAEILLCKQDFLKQAVALQGSRDLGAQLFCALLRAVGTDARLVCSLQVLPFTGVAKRTMPRKPDREYIVLSEDDDVRSSSDAGKGSPMQAKPRNSQPQSRMRRIGQPRFSPSPVAASPKPKRAIGLPRGFAESPFPVFWVEVFNEAMQKWVSVDPLVTNSVGKTSKFEPPASDRYNNMSYVIAFEDDASARDVTKRYTKSFNSKTRKQRVESTKNGEEWWARTMGFFEKPFLDDRDQVEIGELTAKLVAEVMPRNVQDFKDHPVYALERHLRRNEVIFPKREVGKVGLSKVSINKKNPPLESVYRRGDVHVVKSADGWYRLGREVKMGEQPLKRFPISRPKWSFERREETSDYEEELQETPMYAIHQTELYKPPPVVDNRVVKNAYGNIDVYTPTMVPEGGFHLSHAEAARAARILGIDYADAVTGFHFKGRHGTAVVQGIVASVEYREALYAVIDALEDERVLAEQGRKAAEALRMWKLLLLKLRVAERVRRYAFEGEEDPDDVSSDGDNEGGGGDEDGDEDVEAAGGFIRGSGRGDITSPNGGFAGFDDLSGAGGFIPETTGEEASSGGGFMPPTTILHEAGSSTSISTVGNARVRPRNKPLYTLLVTPAGTSSQQQPAPTRPTIEMNDPEPHTSSPMTSTQTCVLQHQHQQLQTQQPQSQSISTPQLPQPSTTTVEGSPTAPITVPSSSGNELSTSVEEKSELPDLVHETDTDSEIDQSSMLSRDPEDDDAEPDWLLSDN